MDDLPHRDEDRVLTLHSHYFLVAEVMLEDYDKLKQQIDRLKNPRRLGWKLVIYYNTWLSFLGVTCEGWRRINMHRTLKDRPALFSDLIPKADEINSVMNLNFDPLRKYRNSVVHLRSDTKDVLEFLTGDGNKPEWAVSPHYSREMRDQSQAIDIVYNYANGLFDEVFCNEISGPGVWWPRPISGGPMNYSGQLAWRPKRFLLGLSGFMPSLLCLE